MQLFDYIIISLSIIFYVFIHLFQPKPEIELCTYGNTSCYKCQLSTDLHRGRTYLIK